MQLQIECNPVPFQEQSCLICNQLFNTTEAKVIICNDQGKKHGEACPACLGRGFNWLNQRFEQRFEQLNTPSLKGVIKRIQPRSTQPLALSVDG